MTTHHTFFMGIAMLSNHCLYVSVLICVNMWCIYVYGVS
jgi:hypothetical protein